MKKLTNKKLRKIIKELPRVKGTKKLPNYSVVNEGFPGKFNLSFTEPEMLKEFNSYLKIPHNLIYSKVQPCIRSKDFEDLLENKEEDTHLALFDLADIHGQMILSSNKEAEEKLKFAIESIWHFLIKTLKFSPKQIIISSFAGGKIKQVTKNKYNFTADLPKEKTMLKIWKELGATQFKFDKSRETFLSLNLQRPTPWGYRNEIHIKTKQKLIDVATLEFFCFSPIFKNNKIIGLKKWENIAIVSGCGIERILMSKNKYKSIIECDHILPIYNKILRLAKKKDKHAALIITESIRALHRVFTDNKGYSTLSKTRKELIKKYLRALRDNLKKTEIPKEKIKTLLSLDSKLQDYYPELKKWEKQTYKDILAYIETLDKLEEKGKLK